MIPDDKKPEDKKPQDKRPEIYNEKRRREEDDHARSRDKPHRPSYDSRDKYRNNSDRRDNRDRYSNYNSRDNYNQNYSNQRYDNSNYKPRTQKRDVYQTKVQDPKIFTISQNLPTRLEFTIHIKKGPKEPTKNESKLAQLKNRITPIEKIWTSHIKQYLNDSEFVEIQRKKKSLAYGYIEYGKSIIKYQDEKENDKYDNSASQSNIFSRAYFKLWEILSLGILQKIKDKPIKIGCVAEGPGGFIHSIIDYRLKDSPKVKDQYYAITLKIDENTRNAKDWSDYRSKSLFDSMRSNGYEINLSYGATGTGDLLKEENIDHFADKDLKKQKCFLVTGDGGIECIGDKEFDYQEVFNVKLFLGEMITALKIQQIGGTFILKVYDCSFQLSRQLLTILCVFYGSVKMVKPITSRPGNSEKYMLCQNFLGMSTEQQAKLKQLLKEWTEIEPNLSYFENTTFVQSIIDFHSTSAGEINQYLISANDYFLKEQQAKLEDGLELAKSTGEDARKIQQKLNQKRFKQQISYAYSWCKKYHIATIEVHEEQNKT